MADGKKLISVDMSACAIAAGARDVMNSFANEIRTRGIGNVGLRTMSCEDMGDLEPVVEVCNEDGTKTTYIKMDEEKAAIVVDEHIIGGRICKEYTTDV